MGEKFGMSEEFAELLKTCKNHGNCKGKGNLFSYSSLSALKIALEKEIEYKKNNKISEGLLDKGKGIVAGVATRVANEAEISEKNLKTDHNLELLRRKRTAENKAENTSFMKFASDVIGAINSHLDKMNRYEKIGVVLIYKSFENLYKSILDALEEYRRKTKKYHIFKSSELRGELANRFFGGGLRPWLKDSQKALYKSGTKFLISKSGLEFSSDALKAEARNSKEEEKKRQKEERKREKERKEFAKQRKLIGEHREQMKEKYNIKS